MKRIALIGAAGLVLAGCAGSHHAASPPPRAHYPVVVHSPLVLAMTHGSPGVRLQKGAELLSPTRLGIVTVGSGSCPAVPDMLTLLGPDSLRIHLSLGAHRVGKLVTHPLPNGCTLDLTTTQMLIAIDPKQIDVHRPLRVKLVYYRSTKPEIRTAAPLKS
jgi:hypothetical protein